MRLKIRQMIKLMSLGFIGLALLSCSKGDSEPEYQKPIEFSGYTARSVTKAGASFVTGAELPSGQPFGVYAYNTGSRVAFKEDPDTIATYGKFMTNVPVTYNGNGADIATNYPYSYRYWPNSKESNRLAFFAYYPYGDTTGITQSGFAAFSFTVKDDPARQIDFMLSDVVENQMYGATNAGIDVVKMSFNHMLTQVRFLGITDAPLGATVKITSLKVVKVINKGTLAPNDTAALSIWTPDDASLGTYTLSLKNDTLPSSTINPEIEAVAITETSQTLLMVPQTISDDAKIQIEYAITTTNPARVIKETAEVALNSLLEKWEKRQQIVYTIKIGLHPIQISASANDWDEREYDIIVD